MAITFQEEFDAFLKQEDKIIPKILAKIEKATNVNREHVVYAIASIFPLYLIFGQRAELLCNAVGLIYPIFATLKTIQDPNQEQTLQWLAFWMLFGAISLLEFFMRSWPFYWLLKCVGLLILYLPTSRGAERIYLEVLDPLQNRLYQFIDKTFFQQTKIESGIDSQPEKMNSFTPPETPIITEQCDKNDHY